jgi:predicted transcriptional regulator
LTKISTNVSKDNPTKSAGDLPGNPVTTSTVSTSKITQMGSVRDKAVTQLKTIRDKAQREEDANFLPVITERVVIQKVRQTINTGGSTSAVYTKPSPLLTK